MIRVGIVGTTGYGARELIRLLLNHPEVQLTAATSESAGGQSLVEALPAFGKLTNLVCDAFNADVLAHECDVVFVGVPSTKSMPFVAALRKKDVPVIDIGADFRLKDTTVFKQHYKVEHAAPELLSGAVYGLPPIYRSQLKTAQLVAVPGCYPVTVVLPVKPLLDAPIDSIPIVVDSISGISGAGRSLNEAYHFPEMNENVRAYRVANHQHAPEIEQELEHRAMVQFTPHVGPYTRGILSTITVRMTEPFSIKELYACYADEPFVRVLGEGTLPELKHVRGSNFCDFGWVVDARTGNLVIVSAIDNLMGGTAGLAIQCMNIMFGIDERVGLLLGGMAP